MNLHCDLDLENNNLNFYTEPQFGYKKISSSADMIETVILDRMSPHSDPELEDSKLILVLAGLFRP